MDHNRLHTVARVLEFALSRRRRNDMDGRRRCRRTALDDPNTLKQRRGADGVRRA